MEKSSWISSLDKFVAESSAFQILYSQEFNEQSIDFGTMAKIQNFFSQEVCSPKSSVSSILHYQQQFL